MLPTYQGLLRVDRIEWDREGPALPTDHPVRVHITFLDPLPAPTQDQGQRMADALTRLAALQGGNLPEDPLGWQKETREDRSLPGRDD